MYTTQIKRSLTAGLLGMLTAASQAIASPTMPPVTVLFEGAYCGADNEALEWVTDQHRLDTIRNAAHSQAPTGTVFPTVKLSETAVFLLSLGTRPTPGYRTIPDEAGNLDGTTLTVTLHWQQPPEGMILPQVITTPCLLFSVPDGNFDQLRLIDQHGMQRLSVPRP